MNTYTVKPGDTLSKIARDNNLTLSELLAVNSGIINPNFIQVGDIINIPSSSMGTNVLPAGLELDDVDVMARTIMGEARGEPEKGRIAVGWVILNRAKSGKWFGGNGNIYAVCHLPYHFSCWNQGDPNRSLIVNVKRGDRTFDECISIAIKVLNQSVPDPTNGATHFHANYIQAPAWTEPPAIFTVKIGVHLFYKNVS